jgi:HK97 family phage major capsid protein
MQTQTIAGLQAERRAKLRDARALIREITDETPKEEARAREREFDAIMAEADDIEARIDALADSRQGDPRRPMHDGEARGGEPGDSHETAFARFLRGPNDERAIHDLAAFDRRTASGLTGGAGGFLVPEVISREVQLRARASNPFRELVRTVSVTSGDVRFPLSNGDASQGWVGETDERTATTEPTLVSKAPTFGVNYSYLQMSEELAMDAIIDIQGWFEAEAGRALGEAEAAAIVSGNGTNKPKGFLAVAPETGADGSRTADALKYLGTGAAATLGADVETVQDNLASLVYDLKAGYRAGGTWLMNSATAGTLRKLKDDVGRVIWSDGMAAGEPARLMGYPVAICEAMPSIGANAFPIAFGDWSRAYVLAIHGGIYVQNADRNITTPGLHKFYIRQRIGGCAYDENAVRLLKCEA